MVIKTEFKARSLASDPKADNKIKVQSGNMTITTTVTMPVDITAPATKAEMKMKLSRELVGQNDDGKELRAIETIDREWERSVKPVEPRAKPANDRCWLRIAAIPDSRNTPSNTQGNTPVHSWPNR